MAKADSIEVDKRLKEAVSKVVNDHLIYSEFINYCEQEWGIKKVQATVYWNRVAEYLKEKNNKVRDKMIDEQVDRYWQLYKMAVDKGDIRVAKDILQDLNKMKGLNEAEKKDITSAGEKISIKIDWDE